ncbi:MAG TPA: MFS transporter [Sphingobacteriaceae bacterium]|nr:MFS transporter [Sphingobacteriaceae bacterium]
MKNKSIYPWVVVGLLWVVAFLNYIDRQMLATMKQAMMVDFKELNSAENFGILMAIFLWIYALMSPISGIIADRINRKWLIITSLFIWSAVTLMMGYATSFNQLYALRAIMGVSEAFYMPSAMAMIVDYHQGKNRSLAVGIHMTGIYLGQAMGGFGAMFSTNFSWQTTFHTFGLIGTLYSVVLMIFLKEKRSDEDEKHVQGTFTQEFVQAFKGMRTLLGSISFWVILFYFASPSFPGWATKNWLPTLISTSLNIKMDYAGPLSTITLSLSSLVGVLVGGIISDRWVQRNLRGRIYTGVIGLALTIPSLLLLAFSGSIVPIVIGAIGFGLGFGIFDVSNMPILCQFALPRHRATGYGLMNLVGISAGAFITTFLGKSADAGNLGRDFAILGIVVLVAIVLQLTMLHPKQINKTVER